MKLGKLQNGNRWYYNGKLIQWIAPEHCLLLVGYDDEHYIFNDPLRSKQTYYRKSAVEIAYAGLFKQAVVITNSVLFMSIKDRLFQLYQMEPKLFNRSLMIFIL